MNCNQLEVVIINDNFLNVDYHKISDIGTPKP